MEIGSREIVDLPPGPADPGGARLGRRDLALVALAVFLVHLGALLVLRSPGSFLKYPLAARQLASGELPRERLIDFSPLYLGVNRLAVALEPLIGPAQKALPVLQVALLAWAAAALAGAAGRHLGRGWAVAFAAVFAFDRHLFTYVRVLEPEILLLALLASWLFFLERAAERPRGLVAAGIAAALAIATRPTFLPVFLLVVPLWLGFRHGFRPASPWLRRCALFLAPVALALLLLGWRAAAATGDFGAPAMNPGTVFYEGHQPLSTGVSARYPPAVQLALRANPEDTRPDAGHVVYREIARAEMADPALPIAAVNEFWAGRARAFLRDQPALALRRALTQLRYAVHAYAFHDVGSAMLYSQRLPGFFLPFSLLTAFAAWGAAASAPYFRERLLFYAILAAQLGVMALFYVSARQRMVLLPAVAFFALLGLADLRERGRRGLAMGLLLALLALAFSVRDPTQNEDLYRQIEFSSSLAMRDEIQQRLAAGASLAALREEVCAAVAEMPSGLEENRPADVPQDAESFEACVARRLREKLDSAPGGQRPSLEFDLGAVELALGRLDAAEALLRPLAEEGRRFPREGAEPSAPRFYLARIAYLRGDPAAARTELERGLAEAPGEPFLLAELAALTGEAAPRDQVLRYYSRLDLDWIAGRALLFYRQPAAAREALAAVVARLPAARRPRLELAIALGELGRDAEALAELERAYQGASEPTAQASRVLPLLERLAAGAAGSRERAALGILLFHHGAFGRAAELLGPALAEMGPAAPPQLQQMLAQARRPG